MYSPLTRDIAQQCIDDLVRAAQRRALVKAALRARREQRRAARRGRHRRDAAARLTTVPLQVENRAAPAKERT